MSENGRTGVELLGVSKVFADGTRAVDDLSLRIDPGEFVVMVGPSGCGKSTTLRLLAGLEEVSEGEILIDGRQINHLGPGERDIAMVFQDYALYPHMTVAQNIGFSLRLAGIPKKERRERVADAARILELVELLDRKPRRLSGGQRQRVAMGRAIVRRPKLFLLDEPLSNLDAKLRVQMRGEITELQERLGVTTFYVTHDQVEAMTMADRVAVISGGVLQQFGAPNEIFDSPDNVFVAAFMGSPSMNLLEAVLVSGDSAGMQAVAGSCRIPVPPEVLAERPRLADYAGQRVVLGIRPKDLHLSHPGQATDLPMFSGPLRNVEILGFETIVYLEVDAPPVAGLEVEDLADGPDGDDSDEAKVAGQPPSTTRVAARISADQRPRIGDSVAVSVDHSRLHFFDATDGAAIRT